MAWDAVDFIVFGVMLMAVGLTYRFAIQRSPNLSYRFAVAVALAAAFLLLWVNGGVGIIGNEANDANLMYPGMLVIAVVGAFIARFRPRGMAIVLVLTAFAQVVIAGIAVFARMGSSAPLWPKDVLLLTTVFVILWLASAWLFRTSAQAR